MTDPLTYEQLIELVAHKTPEELTPEEVDLLRSRLADSPEHPWPKSGGSPPQKPYPVSAESLLFQMDLAGVQRVYLVPPTWQGNSNAVAIDAAARFPDRFAVLGRLDILDPNSPGRLAAWKQQTGMVGFRCLCHRPEERAATGRGSASASTACSGRSASRASSRRSPTRF